jgi:UDP-glucose 4-epimerase
MILITGGAGYIGSQTNKVFNQQGYETIVYDNLVHGYLEFVKWGHFVLGDLFDINQLRICFNTWDIDAVLHFGGYAYVGESVINPEIYYHNNVINTLNLLNVMREFDVKYVIFSSTCSTYGVPQITPLTEDHPQQPINPYGWGKLMIEQILRDYDHAYGIKHVSLRYFNAAGADPDAEIGERHVPETHLIPLILNVAAGLLDHIEVFGTDYKTKDGTCIRDYIHIKDLAEAHLLALEYLKKNNRSDTFNLGNGNGFSVYEVIEAVEAVTGRRVKAIETTRRAGDPPILIGSSQKAGKMLNWSPKLPDLLTIIETAWQWHLKSSSAPDSTKF